VLVLSLLAAPAHALTFTTPTGAINCDIGEESLAVKVVYCVKMGVFQTTEAFLAETSAIMEPVINALMVLVLILLGVRLGAGERDHQKVTMDFLLRLGAVYLFADNFGAAIGGLTDDVFLTMEQFQAVAIPVLYGGLDTPCQLSGAGPGGGYIITITYTPWEYIDCVLDYLFGFGVDTTIASSIFGFVGSAFFSGSIGGMLFMLGIVSLISIAFFVFRVLYIVLVSYIYVGFMIVLSPFFIPLLMFKMTERNFIKWLYNLTTGMMLPLFMVAYLAFAFTILDDFVFDEDEYALTNTLGRDDDVTEHYRLAAPTCEMSSPSDFFFFEELASEMIKTDPLNPRESGSTDWCGLFDFTKTDMGEEHDQETWEVGYSMLQILAITYLISAVGRQLPNIAAHISGGGYALIDTANESLRGAQGLFFSVMRGGTREATDLIKSSMPGNLNPFSSRADNLRAASRRGRR
jgi:hypothetical protein